MFGLEITLSINSITLIIPIENVQFYIVKANTPFLLSLADIDRLYVYFNNLTNSVIIPYGDVLVIQRFGHYLKLYYPCC